MYETGHFTKNVQNIRQKSSRLTESNNGKQRSSARSTEKSYEIAERKEQMDRRQQKTRKLIFEAFSTLLAKKKFSSITVQEIINEANIGRSTFYSHFETKDELLRIMCNDIFDHVFSEDLDSEQTHDFSNENDLKSKLTHILYHLQDKKKDIVGILSYESGELFLYYFKIYLTRMLKDYLPGLPDTAPPEYVLQYLVGGFSETIVWWTQKKMAHSPEEIIRYFYAVTRLS